jgi:hypothetical protein
VVIQEEFIDDGDDEAGKAVQDEGSASNASEGSVQGDTAMNEDDGKDGDGEEKQVGPLLSFVSSLLLNYSEPVTKL